MGLLKGLKIYQKVVRFAKGSVFFFPLLKPNPSKAAVRQNILQK